MVIDFPEFSGYPENDALMAVILFLEAWYQIRCVGTSAVLLVPKIALLLLIDEQHSHRLCIDLSHF
jgi:hypothetical protein